MGYAYWAMPALASWLLTLRSCFVLMLPVASFHGSHEPAAQEIPGCAGCGDRGGREGGAGVVRRRSDARASRRVDRQCVSGDGEREADAADLDWIRAGQNACEENVARI